MYFCIICGDQNIKLEHEEIDIVCQNLNVKKPRFHIKKQENILNTYVFHVCDFCFMLKRRQDKIFFRVKKTKQERIEYWNHCKFISDLVKIKRRNQIYEIFGKKLKYDSNSKCYWI